MIYTDGMLDRLRMTLLCLLALALPVQGFAAATTLLCTAHQQGGPAQTHATSASDVAAGALSMPSGETFPLQHRPDHQVPAHPAHGHHHADDATVVVTGVDQTPSHDLALAKPDGKCSACATCCTAVALPTTVAAFQPVKADSPPQVVLVTPPVWFVTDGQDRPPRSFLA